MLSVLAFKQSLAAGILDGGDSEIALHGTRLTKFMETVDQVTGAMSGAVASSEDDGRDTPPLAATSDATMVNEADGEDEYRAPADPSVDPGSGPEATATAPVAASTSAAEPTVTPTAAAADPWAPLLAAGAQVLGELLAASRGDRESVLVHTDPATGERFLKLPVPDAASVQKLAEGLLGLLAGRR